MEQDGVGAFVLAHGSVGAPRVVWLQSSGPRSGLGQVEALRCVAALRWNLSSGSAGGDGVGGPDGGEVLAVVTGAAAVAMFVVGRVGLAPHLRPQSGTVDDGFGPEPE